MTDIAQLERDLIAAVSEAKTERALEDVRVAALGKKGAIAELLKTLGSMSPEERARECVARFTSRDRAGGYVTPRLGRAARHDPSREPGEGRDHRDLRRSW